MKLQMKVLLSLLLGVFLVVTGCSSQSEKQEKTKIKNQAETKVKYAIVEAKPFKIKNIRGIGYPGNDNGLYVAANEGLKIYKDTNWFEQTANRHDFIGFQAVESGFLGSGHPQKGTGLKDPLGIVKSDDHGETLKPMAFYGKKNFHFMAASYTGEGIYVIGEQSDDDLGLGVHYSKDQGATWTNSTLKGFSADSYGMLAVHSKNGDILAMATRTGIYYSTDNGNTLKLITDPIMVTALTFSGDYIVFSSVENNQILLKALDPATGKQANIPFPFLDYDNPITYLAVNPKEPNQIAFTTYKNDVYESVDGGKKWSNILKDGKH